MTQSNTLVGVIGQVALALAIVVAATLGFIQLQQYLSIESDRLTYNAVDECLRNSGHVQTTEKMSEDKQRLLNEPIKMYYTMCMKDKGLTVSE